jgi:IclR family transcriptional regulator, acetate operon repressor
MPQISASRRSALGERPQEDTIVSVERAFEIVAMLADESEGASLADIARHLDVNKAIAVKLLATLDGLGIVWRDDVAQRYNLTYRISNLGLRQLQKTRLLDQSAAVLKGLAEETGELVRLAVVESGDRITWVYAVSGAKRTFHIDPNYSLEAYLHTTAIGKSWLATLPFELALKYMLRQGMKPLTRHTKTSAKAIRAELELTRKRGFATSFEESELGVIAIAAPIIVTTLTGERECVGAVSLAAPTNRMNARELVTCSPQLLATVERLSQIWPLEPRTLRVLLNPRRSSAPESLSPKS